MPGEVGGLAAEVTAHTLLNCLVREVSGPERQVRLDGGWLLVRLPRRDTLLRVRVRRPALTGAHRFSGPVEAHGPAGWAALDWLALARAVQEELELRTGAANDEFLAQVAASQTLVAAGLRRSGRLPGADPYLASEQSLVFGHRYHPAPKARCRPPAEVLQYAPEVGARFRLRQLAVRPDLVRQECVDPAFADVFDRAAGATAAGYRALPVHPWQFRLLADHPGLRAALRDGSLLDLGPAGPEVTPTASVRTVHHPGVDAFLKLSLSVRITNCVRRHAGYELAGAVALTALLRPVAADLAARFPGTVVLAEPAYRTVEIAGAAELTGELGVIARDGLRAHLGPGVTPVLAAAIADEHSTGPAAAAALLRRSGGTADAAVEWWDAYLRVLVPPVLHAYFEHGVVFEPHLQNVVVGVGPDGVPRQALLRDMEGTKLVRGRHRDALAALPGRVRDELSYDAEAGWNRVAYCLFVNHLHEVLAAVADRHPAVERRLWDRVRHRLVEFGRGHGGSAPLRALLSGVPLPAKTNLLVRWDRRADRFAGYAPLPNPIGRTAEPAGDTAAGPAPGSGPAAEPVLAAHPC